jgi:hypothetical protein
MIIQCSYVLSINLLMVVMCSGSLCVREKWMIQLHVSVYLCISAACPTRTMFFPVSLATSPTTSSPHPTLLLIQLFLSSLRSCVSVSLFFDATRDIPPSLLSISQLLLFLILLDSSIFDSFTPILLDVSSPYLGPRPEGLRNLLPVIFSSLFMI